MTAQLIILTLCCDFALSLQEQDSSNSSLFIGVAKTQKLVVVCEMSLPQNFKTTCKQNPSESIKKPS